ncbi:MAG: RlmE family RNA methyltransferase [Planctomycetes bacterium]|nr:RlmE family RNA methyltransferase [Planctomycetota bacterium]
MRKLHDAFFKQAKREGYFARSVYKLEAMNRKFKLFKKGDSVLDLGSSPGSWIQLIRKVVGEKGAVAGVDITPVKPSVKKMAMILQKDIILCGPEDFAPVAKRFDAVVSDMAPNTSGIRITDQAASLALAENALNLAKKVLKKGGHFVAKIFESPEAPELLMLVAKEFREAQFYKPPASRAESFETFVVAQGFGLPPLASAPGEEAPPPPPKPTQRKKKRGKRKGGRY